MLVTSTWFDPRHPDTDKVAQSVWFASPTDGCWISDPHDRYAGLRCYKFAGRWTFDHVDPGWDKLMASQGGSRGCDTRKRAMRGALSRLHQAQEEQLAEQMQAT